MSFHHVKFHLTMVLDLKRTPFVLASVLFQSHPKEILSNLWKKIGKDG
jgi:hypothetical protein